MAQQTLQNMDLNAEGKRNGFEMLSSVLDTTTASMTSQHLPLTTMVLSMAAHGSMQSLEDVTLL